MTLLLRRLEDIPFRPDVAFQRHDDLFANGIDRRIRDLSKQLFEIIVGQTWLIAQASEGRIVTHGADRILLAFQQRDQHELQGFRGKAKGLESREQFIVGEITHGFLARQLVERESLILQPLFERPAGRYRLFEFLVRDNSAFIEVHEKHFSGLQTPFVGHVLRFDIHDADLTGHDHPIILSDVVPAWTKAVSIQNRANIATIRERHRGRTIPRFLQRRVVLVERAFGFGHAVMILPGLWDHHHHRLRQGTSRQKQEFEGIVKVARVAVMVFTDRKCL